MLKDRVYALALVRLLEAWRRRGHGTLIRVTNEPSSGGELMSGEDRKMERNAFIAPLDDAAWRSLIEDIVRETSPRRKLKLNVGASR